MKNLTLFLLFSILISCNDKYEKIDNDYFEKLSIKDTLLDTKKVVVMKVGDSISDRFPNIVVEDKASDAKYLFKDYESELENDSIIRSYYPAFIYDDDGG
ncbi:hypothetical protein QUT03_22720, partial [Xanthomonas citri pv. citri]